MTVDGDGGDAIELCHPARTALVNPRHGVIAVCNEREALFFISLLSKQAVASYPVSSNATISWSSDGIPLSASHSYFCAGEFLIVHEQDKNGHSVCRVLEYIRKREIRPPVKFHRVFDYYEDSPGGFSLIFYDDVEGNLSLGLMVGMHVSKVSFGRSRFVRACDAHFMLYDQEENTSKLCQVHVDCRSENFRLCLEGLTRLSKDVRELGVLLGCLAMDLVPWICDNLAEIYGDAKGRLFSECLERLATMDMRTIEQRYASLGERILQEIERLECPLIRAHCHESLVLFQRVQEASEKIIDWIKQMRLIGAEATPDVVKWQSSCTSIYMAGLVRDIQFIANGAGLREMHRMLALATEALEETVALRTDLIVSIPGLCDAFSLHNEQLTFITGSSLWSLSLNQPEVPPVRLWEDLPRDRWLIDHRYVLFMSRNALCKYTIETAHLQTLSPPEGRCITSASASRGGMLLSLSDDRRQLYVHELAE